MKPRRVLAYTLVLACAGVAALSTAGADWWRLLRHSPYESVDIAPLVVQATVAGKGCSYERDDFEVPGCQYLIAMQAMAEANARDPAATWAGNYWRGDGYSSQQFTLGVDGRVIGRFEWDAGGPDTFYGELHRDDRRVQVKLDVPAKPQRELEFLLVQWGARRYLVGTDELDAFVNAINRSEVGAGDHRFGEFLLHEGDEATAVCGRPDLPAPWRERLRDSVQQGRILAVTKMIKAMAQPRMDDSPSMQMGVPPPPGRDIYRVRMQAGRAEGVFEGQEFSWSDNDDSRSFDGFVTTLGEHEAELEVDEYHQFCPEADCAERMPTKGMLLVSSRKPPVFPACR